MKTVPLLALGAVLLASAAWADAPIYKWVDSKGVVHYSTEPHSDAAKPIGIVNTGNSLPSPSTAPFPASAAGPASAPGADDATLVAPLQADSPACKAAREELSRYLGASSLYKVGANGQKTTLSAEETAIVVNEARIKVRQACSPGGGQ